jgi:hypothetical protein
LEQPELLTKATVNTSTESDVSFLVVDPFRIPLARIREVLLVVVRKERRASDDVTFRNCVFTASDRLHDLAHKHDQGRITADRFASTSLSKVHVSHDAFVVEVGIKILINVRFLELVKVLLVFGLHEVEESPSGGDGGGVLSSEHGSDDHTADFVHGHVRAVRVTSIHQAVEQV